MVGFRLCTGRLMLGRNPPPFDDWGLPQWLPARPNVKVRRLTLLALTV